jgi:hypothetical protein
MAEHVCYIVNKRIDGYIASKWGWNSKMGNKGMSPVKIASLRGMYDENAQRTNSEPLLPMANPTDADLDAAVEKLMNFRAGIREVNRQRLSKGTRHIDRAWDALRHAFSLGERKSRINLISNLFSWEVDRLTKNRAVDRQSVVNGYVDVNGNFVGGEFSILEGVYNRVVKTRQNWYDMSKNPETAFQAYKWMGKLNYVGAPKNAEEFKAMCEHRYKEYTKVLECWNELIPFVLKDLVKKEGIKLGVKKEFAAVASSDSFGENDIAAKYSAEESTRDGWQRMRELESSFGSIGQQVRRIISTVPMMEAVYENAVDGKGNPVFNSDGTRRKELKFVPILDDLGNQVFMDPQKTHQALQDYLKGVQNSEDILKRLCKKGKPGEARVPWMQPIVDMLVSNPRACTQFFCDFKKNFQPYSMMWEDEKESTGFIKKIKTRILNRPMNILKSKYDILLSTRGKFPVNIEMWGFKPVFDDKTKKIDWERLAELRKKVLAWTHEDEIEVENEQEGFDLRTQKKYKSPAGAPLINRSRNASIKIDGKSYPVTFGMRREFLMEVFSSLGYDVTVDAIDSILLSKDIFKVRELLEQLFDPKGNSGFLYIAGVKALSKANIDALQRSKEPKHTNFRILYNFGVKIQNSDKKNYAVRDHSVDLLEVINKHQEGYRVESRARYQDNTMYSYVAPSYLGDRLETIQSFVENDDKDALRNYLEEEYLQSSFFVNDAWLAGEHKPENILNMWVAELYRACDKDNKISLQDSVAAIFSFERDLGNAEKKFEDFTSREHGIDMFIHFFADEQQQKGYEGRGTRDIGKKLSAMYPVFILGDAGVSKYIRAPRITSAVWVDKDGKVVDASNNKRHHVSYVFDNEAQDKVIDQFWNIYLQEKRRMALEDATSLSLYANGKEVKHPKGEFSILTFLNPDSQEHQEKYTIPAGKESDEATVKQIIRQYMEDATATFKKRMDTLGVLETAKEGRKAVYRNISSVASPENIDAKIKEFFWNTKLATACQLQVMTIDPSYYHGTKDLQKRYKEIHAPGNVLDVLAKNPFSGQFELFCPERTIVRDGVSVTLPAGTETVVYFDDINVNAEETNPEFMGMILRTFAQKGKEKEVEEAINQGILIPKKNSSEEKTRIEKLTELLGSNYDIYKSYTKNTLTDGQGYRTLESYRIVMGMAGKWDRNMEDAYNAIKEIRKKLQIVDPQTGKVVDYRDATQEELNKIASFALTLQPIKPYMFSHEKYPAKIAKRDAQGNIVKGADGKPVMIETYQYIPVQHKYAEALIIPELMPKGSKLRDLGFWMDANGVDMVGSTKIAKVGCFGQANISKASNREELHAAMSSAYIHALPYRDYRIQTNVPEHINSSQLFGTQVRKLIMAGLNMGIPEYYNMYLEGVGNFDGHVNLSVDGNNTNDKASLDGRNLLALYNSLICANILDSYEKFAQNAGSITELSNILQQATVSSVREAMDNLFAYVVTGDDAHLQKFMIPLYEGGIEHDTAALILSTFKKIVNKQQISGGSAVQVSAFGIEGYSVDGGLRAVTDPDDPANVLYAEIEMPFDKSFMLETRTADGTVTKNPVSLDYDRYCNPDGTLIPTGNPIKKEGKDGKTSREWKKYQSYTYKNVDGKLVPCRHDDPEAEVYKPLIEEEYPDILSILAYRIPTERDYSMMNCQIKRFTRKTAGGTLKVPPQWTTIAGFDFDIDKLYFMQREYHKHYKDTSYAESKFSDNQKDRIWAKVYKDYPEVREALVAARNEAVQRDPDNHATSKTLPSGRVLTRPKNPVNSYWEDAKISERYGLDKHAVFAQAAQQLGEKPSVNLVKGEATEWMEEYDFNKPPEENTRASRNNLLITLIQARLMDPQTTKQRYTPGGFANASDAALRMRVLQFADAESITTNGVVDNSKVDALVAQIKDKDDPLQDPEPNYDPTDPYTILVYNQQNQVAAKLIGIFANQNTNHAFASSMEMFELTEPIEFCGHSFKDLLHKGDAEEAARIDLNMAEFLAASVDAVKDPVLNFLNLNLATADAGAVLARLGYTTREIGLLFNQPIIKKICEESFNKGCNIKTAIKNAKNSLLDSMTGYDPDAKFNISETELATSIVKEREMLENDESKTREDYLRRDARMQMAVLNLFDQIITVSQDVSNFVLSTKFTASNAVSSTLGGMYAQQLKVDNYVDRFPGRKTEHGTLSYKMVIASAAHGAGLMDMPIDNNQSHIPNNGRLGLADKKKYLHYVRYNPFAYEQAMYDTNRMMIKLLSKYYPYENDMYVRTRGRLSELARYGTLSEDDINSIHSNIPVALLAKQSRSLFNGEAAHVKNHEETNLTNREYYREKFASDLAEMMADNPRLMELEIFKYICPVSEDIDMGKDPMTGNDRPPKTIWRISMQDVGGLDAEVKEAIRESWAYLMNVKDDGYFDSQDYAELGRDLFMYCFYQLGFDFSPLSFMHLAPVAVKDYIKVPRERSLSLGTGFVNEHESADDVVVWSPGVTGGYERAEEYGASRAIVGELVGNTFQLPDNLIEDPNAIRKLVDEAKSHPELTFKIDRDLTQEEFNLFARDYLGCDVPSNIKFSRQTLSSVSSESKEAISYGVDRTYRQFLNEILEGSEQGLNEDEFAQMWILNHLNNMRFVMDVNRSNDRLKAILLGGKGENGRTIEGILERPGNTQKDDKGNYRDELLFDVSTFLNENDEEALEDLVSFTRDDKGKIIEAKWCPCVCINGAYYMPRSSTEKFNINNTSVITYVKVEPWGNSKSMVYDEIKKLTPQMRYQTSLDAVPQRNKNYQEPVQDNHTESPGENAPVEPMTPTLASNGDGIGAEPLTEQGNSNASSLGALRQVLEDAVFNEYYQSMVKYGYIVPERVDETRASIQEMKSRLSSSSDQEIMDEVDKIRRGCRENGVLMMNDQGDFVEGC